MAKLTQKTMLLLDKLYNLKGDDNLILQEINSKIEGVRNSIASTDEQIRSLGEEKEAKSQDLLVFTTQQDAFLTAFSGVGEDTFAALKNIGVDVNIASMVSAVAQKAPNYMRDSQAEIDGIETSIEESKTHKSELENELEELNYSKTKASSDREALVSLMEQSLSSDETERESLPTKYVKDILNRFEVFDSEEVSTLTKLIMFPEDGLIDYDKEYPERLASGLAGTADTMEAEEAEMTTSPEDELNDLMNSDKVKKETSVEDVIEPEITRIFETPIREEKLGENPSQEVAESIEIYDKRDKEEPTSIIDLTSLNHGEEPETEPEIEPVTEPEVEPKEDSIKDYLESLGMDINKFYEENDKEENIAELMNKLTITDRSLIANNYETLKSINAEVAAYRYRRGHSYLADKELSQKLTVLRSKNISEKSLKTLLEQANSGLREDLETIEIRFRAAEELGTPITDEHIDLLGRDLARLANNMQLLKADEINIDEKEKRNFEYILTNSEFIGADLEVLKNYLINITRSNDKYALNVFVKDPYDLLTDIDNIIENNLEDVLSTNPEVLAERNGSFVERVRYFEGLGKPILDTTGRNNYAPYITSSMEAMKECGGKLNIPMSLTEEDVNPSIPRIIGNENTVSSIVDILDGYYKGRTDFKDFELSPTATEGFTRLMDMFEQKYHAERVTKYAYKVGEEFISKLKLERHLKVIVTSLEKNGGSIDGVEHEILLTAMLYNHRQDEQSLRKMVETCLGFNEENTLGGRTL